MPKQESITFDIAIDNAINECFKLEYFKKKNDFTKEVQEKLEKQGYEVTTGKKQGIGKKIDLKLFNSAFDILEEAMKDRGTRIDRKNYDGIIVKKMEDHNLNSKNKTDKGKKSPKRKGGSGQSDIRPIKQQWQMFPHLTRSDDYMDDANFNNSLLTYYLLKIPIFLRKSNLNYLAGIDSGIEEKIIKSHTTILRNNQFLRISPQNKLNSRSFNTFRDFLGPNDYLIILKLKSNNDNNIEDDSFNFEAFGIRTKNVNGDLSEDENKIDSLNDCFIYLNTITLVSQRSFRRVALYNEERRIFNGTNKLFYGVPGCGKSHHIKTEILDGVDDEYIERVLFYPDYTYGDFIGQILPEVKDGEVNYKFTPGPFTSILEKAFHDPKNEYYLVIEEINRGNAPAIFGDIFQLLDRVDDENSEYPIGTSDYAITNKNIAENIYNKAELAFYGNKIRIPSNLYIIASMNTSDQNVFTLDNAFQRRWEMELIENAFDNEEDKEFYDHPVLDTEVTWEKFCTVINDEILEKNSSLMSSEDKRLGVYFVNLKELEESKKFSQKVIKYLWDDAFKFNRDEVFNERYNSLEYIIKDLEKDDFDKLSIFINELQVKLNKKEETKSENLKEEQAEDNDSE